jgi:hypothetical protein
MMKDFNITIRASSGKFNNLDKDYNKFITLTMTTIDTEKKLRWETYEDPNLVMIDMIDRNKNVSGLLWFIRKRLQEYIEEDFYNRFL